jgi:WXXGXW repeat (2 copies)
MMLCMPASSAAQVSIAVAFAPPDLPIYEQPICPDEGYIWTPGYWAYDYDAGDYYWVPGTWVLAAHENLHSVSSENGEKTSGCLRS